MKGSLKARLFFLVVTTVAALLTAPAAASAAPPGTIRSELNNLCVDIEGGSYAAGARVITWTCHGNANQRWYWDGDSIRSRLNNLCLDIAGGDSPAARGSSCGRVTATRTRAGTGTATRSAAVSTTSAWTSRAAVTPAVPG